MGHIMDKDDTEISDKDALLIARIQLQYSRDAASAFQSALRISESRVSELAAEVENLRKALTTSRR